MTRAQRHVDARVALLESLVRERRTVKEYMDEQVPRAVLQELFELARWAPNHRMTEPWRFRVLGPAALSALKAAAGDGAAKLDRAPTLVAASALPSPLPLHAQEDLQAAACAVYIVLLAAHARGYASYWRTPGVLRTADGRSACGIPANEQVLGLIHLGRPREAIALAPPRRDLEHFVEYLD